MAGKSPVNFVGGMHNATPPSLSDGDWICHQFDSEGNLNVNIANGTISGGNAAAGLTGDPVPTSADYIGFNVSGNLVGVSAANPLPITGSISASNPSVGSTGSTAPTSATEMGVIDNSGNLRGVSSTYPMRIDPTGTTPQPVTGTFWQTTQPVSGTFWQTTQPVSFSSLPAGSNLIGQVEVSDGTNVLFASAHPGYVQFATAQAVTQSGTWNIGTVSTVTSVTAIANALPAGTNLIGQVENSDGTNIIFTSGHPGYVQFGSAQAVTQSGTWNVATLTSITDALPAGSNTIGAVTQASGPWTVTETPSASGGWSSYWNAALTDTASTIKSSAGKLNGYAITNPNASTLVYVLFYNTASPTVGTTTPLWHIGVPGGGAAHLSDLDIPFSAGIYALATTSLSSASAPSTALSISASYL
jgi:hypothetical protein